MILYEIWYNNYCLANDKGGLVHTLQGPLEWLTVKCSKFNYLKKKYNYLSARERDHTPTRLFDLVLIFQSGSEFRIPPSLQRRGWPARLVITMEHTVKVKEGEELGMLMNIVLLYWFENQAKEIIFYSED